MDEIVIEGKNYISSKRAAEITGYTKDYVGQLARAGKILATRVGRSWYVGEDGIKQHAGLLFEESEGVGSVVVSDQKAEEREPSAAEEPAERPVGALSEDNAEKHQPLVSSATVQGKRLSLNAVRMQSLPSTAQKPLLGTWGDIRYLPDDSHIFPEVRQRATTESSARSHDAVVSVPINRGAPLIRHMISPGPDKLNDEQKPKHSDTTTIRNIDGITKKQKPDHVSRFVEINMARRKRQVTPHTDHFAYAGGLAVLIAIGVSVGLSFPSEWAFSEKSLLTASSGALGDGYTLILEYFMDILTEGLELIALFFSTLSASLGELFNIGLEFINNLLNLG